MDHILVPALAQFEDDWHFSHVVRDRGLLLLSGVTGTDDTGAVSRDPAEQFERAFEHLRMYLAAAEGACRRRELEVEPVIAAAQSTTPGSWPPTTRR
jgi:enamine deaminase RidA (YjgF/YER057c/UK114 family)